MIKNLQSYYSLRAGCCSAFRTYKFRRTKVHVQFYSATPSHRVSPISVEEARSYLASLSDKELKNFSIAVNEIFQESSQPYSYIKPTQKQLQLALLESALPFVGFGFLDNFIMILAGEYIDLTIGVTLGISTMAAAAFGNLISDLCGLGLADSVEALCHALGLPNPDLSASQQKLSSVKWMKRLGRVIGITIGCLIGMAPLYWFDDHNDDPPSKPVAS